MLTPTDWIIRMAALMALNEAYRKVLYVTDFRNLGTCMRLSLGIKTNALVMHDRIIDDLPRGQIVPRRYRIATVAEMDVLKGSK